MAFRISKSQYQQFLAQRNPNDTRRTGQLFHEYFKLGAMSHEEDVTLADRIYNADNTKADALIKSVVDHAQ